MYQALAQNTRGAGERVVVRYLQQAIRVYSISYIGFDTYHPAVWPYSKCGCMYVSSPRRDDGLWRWMCIDWFSFFFSLWLIGGHNYCFSTRQIKCIDLSPLNIYIQCFCTRQDTTASLIAYLYVVITILLYYQCHERKTNKCKTQSKETLLAVQLSHSICICVPPILQQQHDDRLFLFPFSPRNSL